MLTKISSVADIIDNNFFEAYGGESKSGFLAARFSTGDTISFTAIAHSSHHDASQIDLPYSVLANYQSRFLTMDGATSGVCLKENYNNINDRGANDWILNFIVWESLESCYSYIMRSADMKYANVSYLKDMMSLHSKYDIFRVVYVSGDDVKFSKQSLAPSYTAADHENIQANETL